MWGSANIAPRMFNFAARCWWTLSVMLLPPLTTEKRNRCPWVAQLALRMLCGWEKILSSGNRIPIHKQSSPLSVAYFRYCICHARMVQKPYERYTPIPVCLLYMMRPLTRHLAYWAEDVGGSCSTFRPSTDTLFHWIPFITPLHCKQSQMNMLMQIWYR